MRALHLERPGAPLALVDVEAPKPAPGGVVIDVLTVRVAANTGAIISGDAGYDLPCPFIPGPTCIGRVREVGAGVFSVRPGQIALCNSFLSSGDADGARDDILIGWTGSGTERSASMQAMWRDGSFAEQAHYPESCVIPLSGATDDPRLAFVASLAIADAALTRAGPVGGACVSVNGASGQLGAAAVLAALARGAARVVAMGRNKSRLTFLSALSDRVTSADVRDENLTASIRDAAGGATDIHVDLVAGAAGSAPTRAGIRALRDGGGATLAGGVMENLPLPYSEVMRRNLMIRGSFMFSREEALSTWRLLRAGLIVLSPVSVETFSLSQHVDAIERAASLGGTEIAAFRPNAA